MAGATPITLVGGLTADPELRFSQNGVGIANFSVAVGEREFDRNTNEWVDKGTSYHRCTAFKELAEHVAGSLHKGDRVIVQGTLRQREFETKEGEKRQVWEVTVDEVGPSLRYANAVVTRTTGGNRNQAARQQQVHGQQQRQQPAQQQVQQQWSAPSAYDSETPF